VQPPAGTIDTFVRGLDPAELNRVLTSLRPGPVVLTLPALDFRANRSLDTALAGMGMPDLFRPGADLSGISPGADHIGVVQQADRLVVNKSPSWRPAPGSQRTRSRSPSTVSMSF
jgi:serine protease inhibitor